MKKKFYLLFLLIVAGIVLSLGFPYAVAASQGDEPSAALSSGTSFSINELMLQRASIESRSDLDSKTKTDSIKNIDQAIGFLEAFQSTNKISIEFSALIQNAPKRLKILHDILRENLISDKKNQQIAPNFNALQIEQLFYKKQTQLTEAQSQLEKWNDLLVAEQLFIRQASDQMAAATKRVKEIQIELSQFSADRENDLINFTRLVALKAEEMKLKAEIDANDNRQGGHTVLLELFRGEQDVLKRTIEQDTQEILELSARIQNLRADEATQALEDAQHAIQNIGFLPPLVQKQFDINIEIGAELEQITKEESDLALKLYEYQALIKKLEEEFETAKRRVDLDVLTDVIGMALRSQRMNLPSPNQYQSNSKTYQIRMSEISERQIDLDRMLRQISDSDALISPMAQSVDDLAPKEKELFLRKMRNLVTDRHDYIQKTKSGYERIIKLIQDIEVTKKRLINTSESFGELLDRHLIWIQSSKPIGINDIKDLNTTIIELCRPSFWTGKIKQVFKDIRSDFMVWFFGIGIGIFLLCTISSAKKTINNIADAINQQNDDAFMLTIQALGLTLFLSMVLPYLILFPVIQSTLFSSVSKSNLINYCGTLVFLIVVYNICRPFGLAQIHFGWPEYVRKILRRHLFWLIPVEAASALIFFAIDGTSVYDHWHSLGKLAMIMQCVALSVFGALVFHFKKGITSTLIAKHPQTWVCRLRYVWYPLSFLVPLYILFLSVTGYYYSAIEIRYLFYKTIALFFTLIVINDLMLRLLLIARRNIAFKKAVEKEESLHLSVSDDGVKDPGPSVAETIAKLNNIDEQTRSILKLTVFILGLIGTWLIWNSVFPAFGILQDIQLWSYSTVSNGVETVMPITLANIFLALIITITMFVAVRNLPGLIEVILLNRLPMDAGARYAYTTVSRYAIIALGIFIALNAIGVRWSNLQWLVAALSVGLGFGLQEIVANFISGLIVLFERPFRVGDTVTVGDVNGTVTRIQIRATTIEDWDRKELIVPNKEFITGQIINWSLSDQVIRIKIPVGIAYGSNTDLAEEILLKTAQNNKFALKSPKPTVVFLRFGDNSLDYEIRAFINSIDNWIPLLHSINKTINKEFEKSDITIAFPQRDVHLDASRPLPVQMVPPEPDAEPET